MKEILYLSQKPNSEKRQYLCSFPKRDKVWKQKRKVTWAQIVMELIA